MYHRHIVSKHRFGRVDHVVWTMLWSWARRRHPNKRDTWIKDRYFQRIGPRKWVFATPPEGKGTPPTHVLFNVSDISIRRHIKIRKDAHPFDPRWTEYFEKRERLKNSAEGRGSFGRKGPYERLEPPAVKVARSVLRGRGGGDSSLLPDEHIQTLKIGGSRLEHNFGHGNRHISNLLAFLVHTAFEFLDDRYRTLRFRYGARVMFFQEFSTLLNWSSSTTGTMSSPSCSPNSGSIPADRPTGLATVPPFFPPPSKINATPLPFSRRDPDLRLLIPTLQGVKEGPWPLHPPPSGRAPSVRLSSGWKQGASDVFRSPFLYLFSQTMNAGYLQSHLV